MHMALCVCADYVHAWGLEDFLYELGNYVATEHDIADIEKAISAVGTKDDE